MNNQNISSSLVMADASFEPGAQLNKPTGNSSPSPVTFLQVMQKTLALLAIISIAYGASILIKTYVVRVVQIDGSSMVPTLAENSKYLVNFWAMNGRELQHNDIVVFRDPGDHGLSVKRVIAIEGDSVLIKDGKVFVNGKKLNEDYLMSNVRTFTYSAAKEQFITLGKGQYFLLGDNRNVSIDSRSYGPVPRANILGLVDSKNRFSI